MLAAYFKKSPHTTFIMKANSTNPYEQSGLGSGLQNRLHKQMRDQTTFVMKGRKKVHIRKKYKTIMKPADLDLHCFQKWV